MTDEELENRLVNWGRASKTHGTSTRVSIAFQPSAEGADASEEAEKANPYREPVDEIDAERVTKAWRQLPFVHYDDKKAKALIAELYCGESGQIHAVLRHIRQVHGFRIFQREVDRLTAQAKADMKKALERLDGKDMTEG